MKLTSNYVRRPPRANELSRIEDAKWVYEHALKNLRFHRENATSTLEIRLTNRTNPNGFIVRGGPRGPVVERFINLAWARRHGYAR